MLRWDSSAISEIEEARIEILEEATDGWVGGEVDSGIAVVLSAGIEYGERFIQELVEGVLCLFSKFAAVAKEEYAFDPPARIRTSVSEMATRVLPVR